MGYSIPELIDEVVVTADAGGAAAGTGAGAGAVAGSIGAAASGVGAGIAASGGGSTSAGVPSTSAGSPTGPSASANPGGNAAKPASNFFGNAVKSALIGGVANTGAQLLMGGRRGITVPPPPGAAMIDPEGAQAASQIRARQAIAGGLSSTITGAGSTPSVGSATSGGKSLLGQ